MKEVLYLSGKITDETKRKEQQNLDRFVDKGVELTDLGYSVILPGENFQRVGERANWTYKQYLRHDLTLLNKADTIYMMQGWKASRGARIEHRMSKFWHKGIIYEEPQINQSISTTEDPRLKTD